MMKARALRNNAIPLGIYYLKKITVFVTFRNLTSVSTNTKNLCEKKNDKRKKYENCFENLIYKWGH